MAELATWTPPKIRKLIEQQRDYAATVLTVDAVADFGACRISRGARRAHLPASRRLRCCIIPSPIVRRLFIVAVVIALSCSAVIIWPSLNAIIDPWLIAPDFVVELAVAMWLLLRGIDVRSDGAVLCPLTTNADAPGFNMNGNR